MHICRYTVDGKTNPPQDVWLKLVITGTSRYQDRWKWLLPASRSSLNPPGPRGKAKNMFYRTRYFIEQMKKK